MSTTTHSVTTPLELGRISSELNDRATKKHQHHRRAAAARDAHENGNGNGNGETKSALSSSSNGHATKSTAHKKRRKTAARVKVLWCLILNIIVLALVITLVSVFADGNAYWRFGPSETLTVVSVLINTWGKWIGLLVLIAIVDGSRLIVEEISGPVLGFSIYNPDKKVITEFTKMELQFFGNAMFFVNGVRGVFLVMITVTQIDIALWSVLASQAMTVVTIRYLLNEKTFKVPKKSKNDDDDDEDQAGNENDTEEAEVAEEEEEEEKIRNFSETAKLMLSAPTHGFRGYF